MVADAVRVENDFNGFAMLGSARRDIILGGIGFFAAHETGDDFGNAVNFFKICFGTPKASAGEIGRLHVRLGKCRRVCQCEENKAQRGDARKCVFLFVFHGFFFAEV